MKGKIIILSTLLVFSLFFSGCISEKELQGDPLVGSWELDGAELHVFENGKGYVSFTDEDGDEKKIDFIIERLSNDTVRVSNSLIGSYTISYKIDGESITITYGDDTYRIEKLN